MPSRGRRVVIAIAHHQYAIHDDRARSDSMPADPQRWVSDTRRSRNAPRRFLHAVCQPAHAPISLLRPRLAFTPCGYLEVGIFEI